MADKRRPHKTEIPERPPRGRIKYKEPIRIQDGTEFPDHPPKGKDIKYEIYHEVSEITSKYEEGTAVTEIGRKASITEYREKEPMTPAKIKEHEPTAVKREMSKR